VGFSLRRKTWLLVAGAFLLLAAGTAGVTQVVLTRGFGRVEEEAARVNVSRVCGALAADDQDLGRTAQDYAQWDRTYEYLLSGDPAFPRQELNQDILSHLSVDQLLLFDRSGRAILAQATDTTARAAGTGLSELERAARDLGLDRWTGSVRSGLLALPQGLGLVAVDGIVRSDRTGEPRGTLIMFRMLDQAEQDSLSHRTRLALEFNRLSNPVLHAPPPAPFAGRVVDGGGISVQPQDAGTLLGSAVLRDIGGRPAAEVTVRMPRPIQQQCATTLRVLWAAELSVALLGCLLALMVVDRAVLSRLTRLAGQVRHLGQAGNLSARLACATADEIGALVGAINGTLSVAESSQADLRDRELRRQLAEESLRARTEELSVANAELARANRLKDEFLASMSHELRTPLNTVLGMAEALREETYGPLTEKQVRSLGYIEESGRHLLALINDILDLSKIEAGKLQLEIQPVQLESICSSALQMVRQPARAKGIDLSLQLDPEVSQVHLDNRRVKQILVNLLSNAVKFTPTGGKVSLKVAGDREARRVDLTVEDTGIGISRAEMDRLFQPFVQLDSRLSRQYQGTGLGLCLVQRLTRMHGGGLRLESEPGRGSRFTISLPWTSGAGEADSDQDPAPPTAADVAHGLPAPERAHDPAAEERPGDRVRILLAEDNEANIATVGGFLQMLGYEVIEARTGREAVQRAAAERPQLILMDVQMPEMDGLEAMTRLRLDAHLASIPILALTALAMPGDRERCLAAGADEYLTKPVSLRLLATAVARHLARPPRVREAA